MSLNRFQRLVVENYGGGDYAHFTDPLEAEDAGDTLFLFLMRELDDDCQDDLDEALRRLTAARLDLQELERVFFRTFK